MTDCLNSKDRNSLVQATDKRTKFSYWPIR